MNPLPGANETGSFQVMKLSSLRFIASGLASIAISAVSSAQAGTLYWDTSTQAGSQVGNNPWDLTTLTWSTTTGATGGTTLTNWTDDSDAVFATPTSGASSLLTVANGSTIKVRSIAVQSSGQNPTFRATGTGAIQLSTSSGNALTNSGGSGLTIDAPLILAGTNAGYFSNTGAGTLTINGDISESGGSRVVRILSGTVSLNGTNSTTGGTKVGAGATMSASKAGAIGSGVIGLEANAAGTTGFKANFSANGTLSNAVTVGLGGDGTSTGVTISSTGAGAVLFSNSASVGWGTAPVGGGAKLGALTLKFSGTSTASNTFAGAIGDSGTGSNITSVVKDEAGTWTLSGNNTYTGATTVSAGTLLVNGSIVSTTTVNSGGTLGGTGTMGAVAVNSGGKLSAGSGIGTLATGALSLNNSSTFVLDLNTTTVTSDRVNVTGNFTLASDKTVTLSLADLGSNAQLALGTTFTFITYSGTWNGGKFSGYLDDSIFTFGANTYQISYNGVDGLTSAVTLTTVPEPTTVGLIVLGGLVTLLRRRKD